MKLKKIALLALTMVLVFISCESDDETVTVTYRDRAEVYAEDLEEIETFLETHYFNYDDFDFANPYSSQNDDFEIVFSALDDNSVETSLMDMLDLVNGPLKYKMVVDPNDEDITYKMYYLEVRQGLGEDVHSIDEAFVNYEGSTTDYTVFDSAVNPVSFELTSVLNGGVVTGFMESLIEFKTATSYTSNGDGTETYHNHGIGATFIPSGIGYFGQTLTDVSSYTPLIFKFNVYDRVLLDHDLDGIPSFLEDLDEDLDVFNDDSDGDASPDFFDADDDGDGYNTSEEIEVKSYPEDADPAIADFTTKAEAQAYFDANAVSGEVFIDIEYNNSEATYTLNTYIATDSNGNGTPDYLDNTYPEE